MSLDNDVTFDQNPMGHAQPNFSQPPKSGAKKWLLGGCGCLSLLALACVGGGALFWFSVGKPMADFANENMVIATESAAAKDALGTPIVSGMPSVKSNQTNNESMIRVEIPLSGPDGSGTMTATGHMGEDGRWERDEIYLEIDGKRIELDPNENTPDIDIDLGF